MLQERDTNLSAERVTIRPLKPSDFPFINRLASQQPSFTPPSAYQTWMYAEVGRDACFVAVLGDRPIGYVLGQITPTGTMFVWQMAVEPHQSALTGLHLVEKLVEVCQGYGLKRLDFTMYPKLAESWGQTMANRICQKPLVCITEACGGENIYELRFTNEPDGLSQPYALPHFATFIERVFTPAELSPVWRQSLDEIRPRTILEIGAGHGRLTPVLRQTGAEVTALEPDPLFWRALRSNRQLRGDHGVRVINGKFPTDIASDAKFDCIVLHQNVLLELLNQEPLRRVVSELGGALTRRGTILFDYNDGLRPGYPGTIHQLHQGMVCGVGYIDYQATYRGYLPGARYAVGLNFAVGRAAHRHEHRLEIEFLHPELEDVIGLFRTAGHTVRNITDVAGKTFFPTDLKLVTLGSD